MTKPTCKAFIKSIDEDKVVLGGYALLWGSDQDRDLENEYFAKDTDFWLDKIPGSRPVLYDHGQHPVMKRTVLGSAIKFVADEIGLSIEAEISRHKQYVDEVLKLIEGGYLGWSSGAVGHLMEREGHKIKSWAIAEMSLTPTPAEPRLLDIPVVKTLLDDAGDILEGFLEGVEAAEIVDLTEAEPIEAEGKDPSNDSKTENPTDAAIIAATVAAILAAEEYNNE